MGADFRPTCSPHHTHTHAHTHFFFCFKAKCPDLFCLSEYRINSFFCPNQPLLKRYDQEKGQKKYISMMWFRLSLFFFNITEYLITSVSYQHTSQLMMLTLAIIMLWQEVLPLKAPMVSTESFFCLRVAFGKIKSLLNFRNLMLSSQYHSNNLGGWASLIAQLVKNPPAMQETWVQYLGWEDSLEKEKATHSSILA